MAKGFALLVYFLIAKFVSVGAQLNLYIAKNDVNSHLKLNFNFDLYMIRNNEPVALLKESRGFYDFMSPLQSAVKGVKMTWFSSPQSTYYSLKLLSSDQQMMPNPVVSIANQGVVPHSAISFYISLDCTGQKAGLVDISMKLNYTKIISTSVKSSSVKTLLVQVKKHCEKTVKTADKETNKGINHWSRGAIVGLSAGITVFLCLSVGLGLLCKHYMKQRRLKMEFEDDLELDEKRQFGQKKVRSLPIHKPAAPSTSPPVVYSPKRLKLRVVSRTRQRSETNGSDTSTLELICKEEPDDDLSGHRHLNTSQELAWPSGLSEILLNPNHLEIKEIIGTGASGDVYRGLLRVTNENEAHDVKEVAVKTLTDGLNSDDNKKLLEAIVFTKELDHPNLLKPFGVILNPSSSLQVITPYMKYSSLDKFLRQHGNSLSKLQLLDMALKIAEVMNYLTSQNYYVHKNLSSKECLIGEEFDVKVACCQKQTTCAKWLAPECLSGDTFSEESDVWSFGVILWELTTCGKLPYAEVEAHCLLDSLKSGNRLHQPLHCSDELYSVMLKCWCLSPVDRPSLQWLVDWLRMYVQTLDTKSTVC